MYQLPTLWKNEKFVINLKLNCKQLTIDKNVGRYLNEKKIELKYFFVSIYAEFKIELLAFNLDKKVSILTKKNK